MKRIAVLIVALGLILCLSACLNAPQTESTGAPAETDVPAETQTAPAETDVPAPAETTAEPFPVQTEPLPALTAPLPEETEAPIILVPAEGTEELPTVVPPAPGPSEEFDFAESDLTPYITLGKYLGAEVLLPLPEPVTEQEIGDTLTALLDLLPDSAYITGRPCRPGDRVRIDYVGRIGEALLEDGSAENFALTLGEETLLPGLEDAICGMSVGETKTVSVTFPEGHTVALTDLRADFEITLRGILPPLDDALAQSAFGAEDLADLRARAAERLEADVLSEFENTKADAAWTKVLANADIHAYPESALEEAFDNSVAYYGRLALKRDLSYEELFPTVYGISVEEAESILLESAKNEVASRLLLYAIGKAEGMDLTDELALRSAVTALVTENANFVYPR